MPTVINQYIIYESLILLFFVIDIDILFILWTSGSRRRRAQIGGRKRSRQLKQSTKHPIQIRSENVFENISAFFTKMKININSLF